MLLLFIPGTAVPGIRLHYVLAPRTPTCVRHACVPPSHPCIKCSRDDTGMPSGHAWYDQYYDRERISLLHTWCYGCTYVELHQSRRGAMRSNGRCFCKKWQAQREHIPVCTRALHAPRTLYLRRNNPGARCPACTRMCSTDRPHLRQINSP